MPEKHTIILYFIFEVFKDIIKDFVYVKIKRHKLTKLVKIKLTMKTGNQPRNPTIEENFLVCKFGLFILLYITNSQ